GLRQGELLRGAAPRGEAAPARPALARGESPVREGLAQALVLTRALIRPARAPESEPSVNIRVMRALGNIAAGQVLLLAALERTAAACPFCGGKGASGLL